MGFADYNLTPASNGSINGINIAEGCNAGNLNDAVRQLMADAKSFADSLAIGSDVQAFSAQLSTLAGLTPSDGGFVVGDGTDFTVEAPAAARTSLGLVIGTNVQAYNAALADISGLTFADGDLLYHDGTNLVKLARGTALQQLRVNAGATGYEWAAPVDAVGVGQTWQDMTSSRTENTVYQNTTGKPIQVYVRSTGTTTNLDLEVSVDGSTGWVAVGSYSAEDSGSPIIPNNHYYRANGSSGTIYWAELR